MRGRQDDLNIRGAFLHMVADALVSAGVVVAGGLALAFGWTWLDPVVSLLIAAVIVVGTWRLFRSRCTCCSTACPTVDLGAVQALLESLPGVTRVHDLHVWAMGTVRDRADRAPGDARGRPPTTPSCSTPRGNCTTASRSST
jgi:cobalt-zinc-cadmium efflux system protein